MICNSCESPNITKLSLVHESGTAYTSSVTTGTGVGYAGGVGGGIGVAHTSATTVSATAMRAAPPQQKNPEILGSAFVLGFILTVIFMLLPFHGLAVPGVAMMAFSAWGIYVAMKYNLETWPALHQEWERLYLCNRCGQIMTPRRAATPIANVTPKVIDASAPTAIPGPP